MIVAEQGWEPTRRVPARYPTFKTSLADDKQQKELESKNIQQKGFAGGHPPNY